MLKKILVVGSISLASLCLSLPAAADVFVFGFTPGDSQQSILTEQDGATQTLSATGTGCLSLTDIASA
jgi:hypothetical protein